MQPFVIALVQQKGGAGKSTIAAHLATAFSKLGSDTLLIDTDPQQTLTNWFRLREQVENNKKYPLKLISTSGLRLDNEISKNKNRDIIVIDTPANIETETKFAIRSANLIILPCQPSPNDLWASQTTLKIINKENKHIRIILNRCSSHSKLLKQIDSSLPENIIKNSLGNRVAFANSMARGLTVLETEPNSVSNQEISVIIEDIYKHIQNR